ncbi:complex I NDUFA9 subunit family protein [Parvularcula marina]|uniref:Complex I NDUFA9 subunit family protein n=1 Tax=Parvularcula marina TaxID=2292771 RepID=A0A371RJZ1_9PROT|nr:complex I NDUFA9 subunit family protein [Parvularcula marina]RFB05769.1 complex I NDUFA9 subunit family protein [Parvularcula marina]
MPANIVTVFGASGFVGRHVVRELASRGWRVRAAVRRPANANYLRPLGKLGQVDIVQANVRYRPSISAALDGASAVVNLTGILANQGRNKFDAVHAAGARNVAEMATKAGITRIVHISAIGANANSESDYARSKAEGEEAFREYAPNAVILRPSIIFGPQDEFFNRFSSMAQLAPALPLIGGGKTRFQPVYVDDVADAVAIALSDDQYKGKTYELGGPEVMSFKELMQLMLKTIGRKRILAPLPFGMAGLMAQLARPSGWTPFFDAPITPDQVKLLKYDNVVGEAGDADGTIEDFGIRPETMEAILPTYLYRYRKAGQFSPETV